MGYYFINYTCKVMNDILGENINFDHLGKKKKDDLNYTFRRILLQDDYLTAETKMFYKNTFDRFNLNITDEEYHDFFTEINEVIDKNIFGNTYNN